MFFCPKEKKSSVTTLTTTMTTETRMEAAYHGKKSDARDRSSEDPRRHTIPRARAGVSPVGGGAGGPRGDVSSGDENGPPAAALGEPGAPVISLPMWSLVLGRFRKNRNCHLLFLRPICLRSPD